MNEEQARIIAEKVALFLQNEEKENSDDFLRASLEKINRRLDKIEVELAFQKPKTKNQKPKIFHPSQEKFANLEELADEITNSMENEKACPYEPTGKPCDHCAMCNSRGF